MSAKSLWGVLCAVALAALATGCANSTENPTEEEEGNNAVNNDLPEPDCVRDSDCPGAQFCQEGQCVDGECQNDADCDPGQVCLIAAGVCVTPQCLQNVECPEGQFCDPADQTCKDGCTDNSNCPDGTICNPNTQACEQDSECEQDSDCGDLQICRDDKCEDVQCVRDVDCNGPGEVCVENNCRVAEGFCDEDADCPGEDKCDLQTNTCVEVSCPECPEGTECNEEVGECWECATDEDCGEGGECNLTDHTCIESRCTGDEDCDGGQVCNLINGQCEDVQECQGDNFEPNNELGAAAEVGEGFFEGLTLCEGDEDWYALELQAGDGVDLRVNFSHAAGNIDVELYSPAERRIAAASSGNNDERLFSENLPLSGTYRLRVFSNDVIENNYDLGVTIDTTNRPTCEDDNFEDNDTPEAASSVVPGTFDELVVCPGDTDFFKVRLERGETLDAALTFAHADGDLDLQILSPDAQTVLAESRTSDDNEQATTDPVEVGGDYLVRIRGAQPALGNSFSMVLTIGAAPDPCEDDTLEPNDQRDEATSVAPDLIDGLRICPGDDDWFSIGLNAGDDIRVEIDFSHDDGDLDLLLYGPDSEEPIADSRSRTDAEEVGFTDVPTSGVYLIRIVGAAPEVENDYLMLGERTEPPLECADDEFEDNDNQEQPALAEPGTLSGRICGGDEDWFAVQVNAGGALTATLSFTDADGSLDLEVFSPGGTSLGVSATDGDLETVNVDPVLESGLHLVRVFAPRGAENDYTLGLSVTEPTCEDDGFEDNDDLDNASLLDLQTTLSFGDQRICTGDDDFYAVDLAAGDGLTATLFFADEVGDLDLQILDEDGRVLASSVSVSDNEEATVGTVETAGLYFVRVFGFLDSEGAYDLDLERIDGGTDCDDDGFEPNDSQPRALPTEPRSFANMQLCPQDEDWFAVELAEREILEVDLTFLDELGDVDLEIRDPNDARIATGFSVTDDESVAVRARIAGTYFVRVFSFSPTINNIYDMDIRVLDPDNCLEDGFEENDSIEEARLVGIGSTEGLGMCQEEGEREEDWFEFNVLQDQSIEVTIVFSNAIGDLDLEIYGPDDDDTPLDRSLSVRDSESVEVLDAPAGRYRVRVFSFFTRRLVSDYDLAVSIE